MKKQKVQAKINLEALAGGAFAEKLNEALMQVAENIQNPNTEATTKRQITVNIKFTPNKTRQMVGTQIAVTTKLAATEAIDTQMVMGVNMRTGQIEIAEYDGQIRGQMDLSDFTDADQDQEPEETQAAAPTPGQNPTGKPLDLNFYLERDLNDIEKQAHRLAESTTLSYSEALYKIGGDMLRGNPEKPAPLYHWPIRREPVRPNRAARRAAKRKGGRNGR